MTDKYSTKNVHLQISSTGMTGLYATAVATQSTTSMSLSITNPCERKSTFNLVFLKRFLKKYKGGRGNV